MYAQDPVRGHETSAAAAAPAQGADVAKERVLSFSARPSLALGCKRASAVPALTPFGSPTRRSIGAGPTRPQVAGPLRSLEGSGGLTAVPLSRASTSQRRGVAGQRRATGTAVYAGAFDTGCGWFMPEPARVAGQSDGGLTRSMRSLSSQRRGRSKFASTTSTANTIPRTAHRHDRRPGAEWGPRRDRDRTMRRTGEASSA